MSHKGDCLDNAAMTRISGAFKCEFFHLNRFANIDELQAGLRRYIHYRNGQRLEPKLSGLSPVQYRMQAMTCQHSKCPTFGGQLKPGAVQSTWRSSF